MIGAHDSGVVVDRRIGRYVLGERIGKGGMAEVFIGHAIGARGFRKPVAIKRLLATRASLESAERLIDEAKLLVGMQHGNIVSVLDLVCEGEDVFLVMEYVDGPSLRQLLKSRGSRLPFGIATYVVHAAALGLEFGHLRPGGAVIHADISPSNLLLTRTGEVRVADFGIARREGAGAGTIEGKWAYMAPEQARGEVLTPRADVFALGVVLYELLTGVRPRGTAPGYEHCVSAEEVVTVRERVPAVPAALSMLCSRALADDPAERPSMKDFADALLEQRYAAGWRDGGSELADLIRQAAVVPPRMPHSVATALISIRPSKLALTAPTPLTTPETFAAGTVVGRLVAASSVPNLAASSIPTLPAAPSTENRVRGRGRLAWLLFAGTLAGVAAAVIGYSNNELPGPREPITTRHTTVVAPAVIPEVAIEATIDRAPVVEPIPVVESAAIAEPAVIEPAVVGSVASAVVEPAVVEPAVVGSVASAVVEPAVVEPAVGERVVVEQVVEPAVAAALVESPVAPSAPRAETLADKRRARRATARASASAKAASASVTAAPVATKPVAGAPAVATKLVATKPVAGATADATKPVASESTTVAMKSVAPRPDETSDAKSVAPKSDDATSAKRVAPKSSSAFVIEGTELYLTSNLAGARQAFEAALAIDSNNALAQRGLGFVHQRTGATAKAIAALRAYLALRPTAHDAAAIEARIVALGGS